MTTTQLNIEELKKRACETIDKRKKEIVGVAQQVLANPEAGFRETKTAQLVAQKFDELGIPHRRGLALTGLKGHNALGILGDPLGSHVPHQRATCWRRSRFQGSSEPLVSPPSSSTK